jgi:hypothetical protein
MDPLLVVVEAEVSVTVTAPEDAMPPVMASPILVTVRILTAPCSTENSLDAPVCTVKSEEAVRAILAVLVIATSSAVTVKELSSTTSMLDVPAES